MEFQLSDTERQLMLRLADGALRDLRVEVRRTRTPDFHDKLLEEEELLKGLIARLQAA
ncbi:MAG: hypothetical protein ACYS15_14750 [Planctomycetota bacterium]|jgi:hypothetical protein